MGWTKSDYEGKVCWEQNGQRVFDTTDIEKIENRLDTCTRNKGVGVGWLFFFLGFLVGIIVRNIL